MTNCSWFENLKVYLFKTYGKHPGKMLIHTGVIGWAMSSAAQILAIAINDKIPKEQKMFMIPQELADATVNIISFYAVTNTMTSVAKRAVSCGRILPRNIRDYFTNSMSKRCAKSLSRIGNPHFKVEKHLPKYLKDDYTSFKNGVDVIATLVGSILSCNIITPIFRNIYASHRQQKNIARMNEYNNGTYPNDKKSSKLHAFAVKNIYSFTNSSGLKI